jgi:hypothetical protein
VKGTLVGFAFVLASAVAFALGNITAARSAVDCPPGSGGAAVASTSGNHTVTLDEGASLPVEGTLLSASATSGRPCDLFVFENGQSKLFQIAPSGTTLNELHVAGTVSASGNPFGYNCSVVLKYTTP